MHAGYDPGARRPRPGGDGRGTCQGVGGAGTPPSTASRTASAHIFAGGYAAGYYSYKWAEVLAADAFSAFEETSVFDADTARRFVDCILSAGGSCDALEAFIAFRGRRPGRTPAAAPAGHCGLTALTYA